MGINSVLRIFILLLCTFAMACASASSVSDPPLDLSSAQVCPPGYFHQIVYMTHSSSFYPEGFSPIPVDIGLNETCPVPIPTAKDLNQKVSCPQGEPERIELGYTSSIDYLCTCRAQPWGILEIYRGAVPHACLEWQSMSAAEQETRGKLLEQRRTAVFDKLLGSRCRVEDVGNNGVAVICATHLQPLTKSDLTLVKAAMPKGCRNLRPARFAHQGHEEEDRGFVFDCCP